MKTITIAIVAAILTLGTPSPSHSHGGGLDGDGGHNCRVGSCAGTYHCHQAWGPGCGGGTSANTPPKLKLPTPVCYPGNEEDFTSGNVAMIQNKLKKAGYKLGTSDGIFGAKTLQALNNFEAKKGLSKSAKDSIYVATMKALSVTC
jgi:hypothetical protein